MKIPTTVFQLFLVGAWLVLAGVTLVAVAQMGLLSSAVVFVGDFAHPWRAQFNTDFAIHLVLTAAWICYRERSPAIGIALGVAAIFLGALFSLLYILVMTVQARGNVRALLLGARA